MLPPLPVELYWRQTSPAQKLVLSAQTMMHHHQGISRGMPGRRYPQELTYR